MTGPDPPEGAPRSPLAVAAAQGTALAAAWALYLAVLFAVYFSVIGEAAIPLSQKIVPVFFLLFLGALEVVVLTVLGGAVEILTWRLRPKVLVDGAKGLVLAAAMLGLALSVVKYRTTSVHLKRTDLWFAVTNARQVFQEFQATELATVAVGLALFLAVWLGGAWGLLRARRRPRAVPLGQLALLGLLAAAGCLYTYLGHPGPRLFADRFVPEVYWLKRSVTSFATAPQGSPEPEIEELVGRPISPYRAPRGGDPPSVVLIMLESVPWNRVTAGGGRAGVTPNLDRLAGRSVVFTRAYATSTHSDYAQMAILSSLYPRKYDHHDYYVDLAYPRTLIWDALEEAGYASAVFSCQNERWGNMIAFLDTPGLDILRHSLSWPRARKKGRGNETKVYEETPVEEWRRWRRASPDGPTFTYFNFQANHYPYLWPPEFPPLFAPFEIDFPATFLAYPKDKVAVMKNRFDNALAYADREVGEVLEFLAARGELEETVVIVVSDHGEAFYEHAQPTHGTSLYEEQVGSVLMLSLPGVEPRVVAEPVSHLDIMPTLLRHLGLPPHPNFQGRDDILDPAYSARGRPLFFSIQGLTAEDGVLLDGWKYLINWDRRERRLFHLQTDPGEQVDLAAVEPGRAQELHRVLMALLARQTGYYEGELWRSGWYVRSLP